MHAVLNLGRSPGEAIRGLMGRTLRSERDKRGEVKRRNAPPKLSMWQRVNTGIGASAAPDLDAQLMLRVRDGDEDSFRVLLEKHRNPLVHFCTGWYRIRRCAEELAQEVFLRIYQVAGQL